MFTNNQNPFHALIPTTANLPDFYIGKEHGNKETINATITRSITTATECQAQPTSNKSKPQVRWFDEKKSPTITVTYAIDLV